MYTLDLGKPRSVTLWPLTVRELPTLPVVERKLMLYISLECILSLTLSCYFQQQKVSIDMFYPLFMMIDAFRISFEKGERKICG